MEAILAESLVKRYGAVRVLDGATLSVERGARVVVYGPTGCGKTTLLYLIAGLLRPDGGGVTLFGRRASGDGVFVSPEARGIGMVFQRAVLWPHMSALENVEFALFESGLPRAEGRRAALEAMAVFGIEGLAKRRPDTLSGGQAQRVALARSIAASPRVLLWDEPFTGLDDVTRDEVAARSLEYMGKAGATLVAVSHRRDDAPALAAARIEMRDGRLGDAR